MLESCQQRGINFYRDTAYRYRQNLQGSYCIVFSRCCFVDRVFFLDLFFTLLVFTCSFHTSQGIKEGCRTSQCRLAEVRIDFNSRYSSPASAEPRLQRDTHGWDWGYFALVRTDRPGHSRRYENFTFNENYPARSVKSYRRRKKKLWKKPISFANNRLVRQWSCRPVLTNGKRLKPKETAAEGKFLARLAHPQNCTCNLIEQMEIQVIFVIFCFIYFASSLTVWSCFFDEAQSVEKSINRKKQTSKQNKILKRNYFDCWGIKFKTPSDNFILTVCIRLGEFIKIPNLKIKTVNWSLRQEEWWKKWSKKAKI